MFARFVKLWQDKGVDVLFRDAPHLVLTSAPVKCPTPLADCIIALTYFELFAQSLGVGTLWNGLLKWAVDELAPELRLRLGVPEDHQLGYAMVFGRPAVDYQRTVEKGAAKLVVFAG
jgi:nitroreductase